MEKLIPKYLLKKFTDNSTLFYLIIANIIFIVFGIWFTNAGLLPFRNVSDFLFFSFLSIALAVYRPSWTFALFIGGLALETINLAPNILGMSVRPYQFFAAITIFSTIVNLFFKRLSFSLAKWSWIDALPIFFAVGGFVSSLGSKNFDISFKQSIIALTFVFIYYLARVYIQSISDLKKIAPFFISSSLVVMVYSIWQNMHFLKGLNSFEIMPGRPNGTFTEPDWLGMYMVFLLAISLTIIYHFISIRDKKKSSVISHQSSEQDINIMITDARLIMTKKNTTLFAYNIFLVMVFVVLILTVARSAWLGAAIVVIGFLKILLTKGTLKISQWDWKTFIEHTVALTFAIIISLLISNRLTNFQIFSRVQSTSGQQKITISCNAESVAVPESISNIDQLSQYGCKHINLEEIEREKSEGRIVSEVIRPDPSLNIRADIYKKTISEIKSHSIFGIGWGSISEILGKDENGNGLNASNIFMEIWLGSGLIGLGSLLLLFFWILLKSCTMFFKNEIVDKTAVVFVCLGVIAIIIPNLFNSGIFLGFLWAYLAVAVSLIMENKNKIFKIAK